MNSDLGLLLVLVGAVVWTAMYVNNYLFRVLHCLGCVCASFSLHRLLLFFDY